MKGLFRSISIRRISRNTVIVSLRKHIDVSISDKVQGAGCGAFCETINPKPPAG